MNDFDDGFEARFMLDAMDAPEPTVSWEDLEEGLRQTELDPEYQRRLAEIQVADD